MNECFLVGVVFNITIKYLYFIYAIRARFNLSYTRVPTILVKNKKMFGGNAVWTQYFKIFYVFSLKTDDKPKL